LEISQVIVPSNREAIQSIRSKSVDPIANKLMDDILNTKLDWPKDAAEIISLEEGRVTKPEETDEFIRIPVDRGDHEGHRIRTIDISEKEGIKAIYCGTDKVVMTYLFRKDHDWTLEKARAWIKQHKGQKDHEKKSLEVEHEISQEEIIDEIDYLKTLIDKEGLSDKAKESFGELIKVMRITGDDTPVNDIAHVPEVQGVTVPLVMTASDILESIKRISKLEVK